MSSKAEAVERLLQVVSVLRSGDGSPVPRTKLVDNVGAYAASSAAPRSLKKMMQRDMEDLLELGFDIEPVAGDGEEGAWLLHAGEWPLPVELDADERALLVWVMAAAGAKAAEEGHDVDVSPLVSGVPRGLDLVQAALAGRRQLRIVRHGDVQLFEPAQLVSRGGRWFVVGRYAGSSKSYGHRVDRLHLDGLGDLISDPVTVDDPELVLDQTAWAKHEPRDVELRCAVADLGAVQSWFPRASVDVDGEQAVLRFTYRNEDALVSRVLGLAWSVHVVSPDTVVDRICQHAAAVLEVAHS